MLVNCPICGSNHLYKWQTEGGRFGDISLFQIECKKCNYKIDNIDKDSSYNEIAMEIHLLTLLEQSPISYDGGTWYLAVLEKTGVKKTTLTRHLNKLVEKYLVEKNIFQSDWMMDTMKPNTKYFSYSISEHGKKKLSRIKRENKLKESV